jgi:hypothetical protein
MPIKRECFNTSRSIEHAGYLLDFDNSLIQDRQGKIISVPPSCLKLFSILDTKVQSKEELLYKFNSLQSLDQRYQNLSGQPWPFFRGRTEQIQESTLRQYLYELERHMGYDVVQRTNAGLALTEK